MTGRGNDARLPYTLSPYNSSSLYTVSLSLVFLIHCLFITRLPYTLSPYHSSSLYTVFLSLVFLIHCLLITPLPYTLSPSHSSSSYTVSLSFVFLMHCLLITRLPYTLSPYHSSSLYIVSLSLVFLIHCLLTRLPYTLYPLSSSFLYNVSLSLVFLIHCLLITRLAYTLSPLSSSLYTVTLSLLFLTTPCFVPGLFFRLFAAFYCLFLVRFFVCLLLSVVSSWFVFSVCLLLSAVCSWFVFPSGCCFLLNTELCSRALTGVVAHPLQFLIGFSKFFFFHLTIWCATVFRHDVAVILVPFLCYTSTVNENCGPCALSAGLCSAVCVVLFTYRQAFWPGVQPCCAPQLSSRCSVQCQWIVCHPNPHLPPRHPYPQSQAIH